MFTTQVLIIGAGGVEKIIEVELSDKDKEGLNVSVEAVKGLVDEVNKRIR